MVADRILARFDGKPILVNGKSMPKTSVSIGIAEHQRHEKAQQFIHRAVITKYEGKGESGNIVSISQQMQDLPTNEISQQN